MTMSTKVASTAEEIASIQELMSDLERRLHRLSGATKREFSGASGEINDFVNDALAGIMDRVREGAHSVSHSAADKATHIGSDVFKKITDEVEQRPLTMLAIATGVGFLFGMFRR
ncbi:MAG TPA: hypothetical protein VLN61_08925 [Pseudolabrys sp.]|nr:hypothetical protein [Pseudolabrys sp.]